jgi:hypothetical protein
MNDLLEAFGFVRSQAPRQAQFAQRAAAACDLGTRGFAAVIADIGNP